MNRSGTNHETSNPAMRAASWRAPLLTGALVLLLGCFALVAPLSPISYGAPTDPASPVRPIEEQVIGAWRLVSVEGNSPVRRVDYDHPSGLIIYDRSGWMSVQIAIHGERKPFAKGSSNGTGEEKANAFDSYFGYYGTWTLNATEKTITHHIVGDTYPGMRGHDNVRWFEMPDANHLVLIPTEDGKGGRISRKDATYKLIWERIR